MQKRFNSTGVCVSRKHYMVDISNKLEQIKKLIDNEFNFTINRPRQYGKTTTLNEINNALNLAFIKPIINGTGFDFKEVQVSEEKRLYVVITYNSFKYIIEMKIWRGLKYHEAGVKQLCDYLDIHGLDKGYLLVFNFNKNKEFKEERINMEEKEIFQVYV